MIAALLFDLALALTCDVFRVIAALEALRDAIGETLFALVDGYYFTPRGAA